MKSLGEDEHLVAAWSSRGAGANALVCTNRRALVAKRPGFVQWMVSGYELSAIDNVNVSWGRFGNATVIHLATGGQPAPKQMEGPLTDPKVLQAPNIILLRKRAVAEDAVQTLQRLIAAAAQRA